ncbi:hypothetical protein BC629DRAFT_1444117 [Irpex lacteus]|nr:hypothetical protein BC629DRAFT_1444117 [Irpex lacteus]
MARNVASRRTETCYTIVTLCWEAGIDASDEAAVEKQASQQEAIAYEDEFQEGQADRQQYGTVQSLFSVDRSIGASEDEWWWSQDRTGSSSVRTPLISLPSSTTTNPFAHLCSLLVVLQCMMMRICELTQSCMRSKAMLHLGVKTACCSPAPPHRSMYACSRLIRSSPRAQVTNVLWFQDDLTVANHRTQRNQRVVRRLKNTWLLLHNVRLLEEALQTSFLISVPHALGAPTEFSALRAGHNFPDPPFPRRSQDRGLRRMSVILLSEKEGSMGGQMIELSR